MYKRKIEKDIRCPLEYGHTTFIVPFMAFLLLLENGIPALSVYWQRRKYCVTVNFAGKWETLQMQSWQLH